MVSPEGHPQTQFKAVAYVLRKAHHLLYPQQPVPPKAQADIVPVVGEQDAVKEERLQENVLLVQ